VRGIRVSGARAGSAGRRVIVLGGSSEIALAIVRELQRRAPREVVLAGRDPSALRGAAEELGAAGCARVSTLELDALDTELHDAETYLKLTETLDAFRARLSTNAEKLTIEQRQEIVRLVVREVLLGDDDVTVRHSIPVPTGGQPNGSLLRSQSLRSVDHEQQPLLDIQPAVDQVGQQRARDRGVLG